MYFFLGQQIFFLGQQKLMLFAKFSLTLVESSGRAAAPCLKPLRLPRAPAWFQVSAQFLCVFGLVFLVILFSKVDVAVQFFSHYLQLKLSHCSLVFLVGYGCGG